MKPMPPAPVPLADALRRCDATEQADLLPRPQRLAEHAQRAEAALDRPGGPAGPRGPQGRRAAVAADAWLGPVHPAEPGRWQAL